MDLIIDHMLEALVIRGPEEDLRVHFTPGKTAINHLITTLLVAIIVEDVGDLFINLIILFI